MSSSLTKQCVPTLYADQEDTTLPNAPDPDWNLSGRSRMGTATGVRVVATGSYAPPQVVDNHDLADLGYDAEWIVQRTGIHQRRHASQEVATSDIAYEAAVRCLEAGRVDAQDVDLILVATMTPDSPMPTTACLLQQRLGCIAPALDMNAACAGFMYALVTGMQFVRTGSARNALIVGADIMSRTVNPADERTYPLFGDGAGAVLLGPGNDEQGAVAYTLGSEGDAAGLLQQPAGGSREPLSPEVIQAGRHFIHMQGRGVFKWAVRVLVDSTRDVLQQTGLTTDDIDLAILHQANIRIIDAAINDLGIEREKVVINLDRYGNTSAGSMPLVLDEAYRAGRISRGNRILLSGFGGGFAWGAAVLQW